MSIVDLFRSKYKHSDPEVRAAAIAELGPEQLEILAEVARDDDDFRLRRLALEKIDDTATLIGLAREAAAPIDQMAGDRAGEILGREAQNGTDEQAALASVARIAAIGSNKTLVQIATSASLVAVRRSALAAIGDDRALADVVRQAPDEAIAQEALSRIVNHLALAAIAVSEPRKAIALAALERVGETGGDAETLERIESKSASKAVRSRARALLTPGEDPVVTVTQVSPEQLAHAERVQLTRTLESLSRAQDFRREAEFTAAAARLEELGRGQDEELAGRFEGAAARYREGLVRYRARAERLAKEAAVAPTVAPAVVPATDVVVAEASLEPPIAASAEQAAADNGEAAEAGSAISSGDPNMPPAPSLDEDSVEETPDEAPRKPKTYTPEEKRIALESLCQNLESLLTSTKIKTINRGLSRAEAKFAELGDPPGGVPELLARLERSRQALLIRAGDLREAMEWQQWANIAKQEQLIERAEKLAADEGAGKLGERLRKLQSEWKELGPAPRDRAQELWEKFKTASDAIYERVKVERKADNEERRANLALKIALCEQAEEVCESENWAETAQLLKRLQGEWKKIGPIPRRQSDKVWKRFRGACDKFFERRKPHLDEQLAEYREAIEEKTALIEEMETLITDEARERPLRERGEHFDALSRKFQRAGRVPPREFASFRKRQDAVEKALKREKAELNAAAEAERQARIAEVNEAIAAASAERQSGSLAGEQLAAGILELRTKLRELGGDASSEAQQALEAEVHAAIEAEPAAFTGTDLDPAVSRQRKVKLCKKVEKLIPENEAPPASSAEDMAAKLRAALADRALGGVLSKQADSRTINKVVTEARESWRRLGPVPGADGAALEERFNGACERAQRNAR